jgi:hypothetical protein
VHAGTTSSCFDTEKPAPPARDPKLNAWECATAPWWMNGSLLNVPYTETGPKSWRRVDIGDLGTVEPKGLPEVTVTNTRTDVDSIRFHVSRTGVPVVVKMSYFPNWKVKGGEGPYRVAPNLMVVVPTSNDVTMTYGLTGVDWLGRLMTLFGIAGLVLLVGWGSTRLGRYAAPSPSPSPPETPPEPATADDVASGPDGDEPVDSEPSKPTPALP